MDNGYAWEKFHGAVLTLAQGQQRLQKRLEDAMISGLCRLKVEDVPTEQRSDFAAILQKLTSTPAKANEGTIAASCSSLSDLEAHDIAGRIVSIYWNICRVRDD